MDGLYPAVPPIRYAARYDIEVQRFEGSVSLSLALSSFINSSRLSNPCASEPLQPLRLPENLTGNRDREQLKGTRVPRLFPISLERLIHKDGVHSGIG